MPRKKYRKLCPEHLRFLPCVACKCAKAGSVSSRKKTKANRKKAKLAALKRWHPELFTGGEAPRGHET